MQYQLTITPLLLPPLPFFNTPPFVIEVALEYAYGTTLYY